VLKAREAKLELRTAAVAREQSSAASIEQLREELQRREDELAAHERLDAERRERLDSREGRLEKLEQDLSERAAEAERVETDLRVREARVEVDAEIREDRLDDLARDLAAREQRFARREQDLAGYVGELQEKFRERDTEWWTKQLGHAPSTLV
jgi:chromosome segregation ATPase